MQGLSSSPCGARSAQTATSDLAVASALPKSYCYPVTIWIFGPGDVEAEVARLEQLGAKRVRRMDYWWVLQDPVGLPFA